MRMDESGYSGGSSTQHSGRKRWRTESGSDYAEASDEEEEHRDEHMRGRRRIHTNVMDSPPDDFLLGQRSGMAAADTTAVMRKTNSPLGNEHIQQHQTTDQSQDSPLPIFESLPQYQGGETIPASLTSALSLQDQQEVALFREQRRQEQLYQHQQHQQQPISTQQHMLSPSFYQQQQMLQNQDFRQQQQQLQGYGASSASVSSSSFPMMGNIAGFGGTGGISSVGAPSSDLLLRSANGSSGNAGTTRSVSMMDQMRSQPPSFSFQGLDHLQREVLIREADTRRRIMELESQQIDLEQRRRQLYAEQGSSSQLDPSYVVGREQPAYSSSRQQQQDALRFHLGGQPRPVPSRLDQQLLLEPQQQQQHQHQPSHRIGGRHQQDVPSQQHELLLPDFPHHQQQQQSHLPLPLPLPFPPQHQQQQQYQNLPHRRAAPSAAAARYPPPTPAAGPPPPPDTYVASMALPSDHDKLTVYQLLLRQSLDYFCATDADVTARVRGRKQKIRLGQIGIRCRYCAHLPIKERSKGAVYYPKSLINVYQAAQNIAAAHFSNTERGGYSCPYMPPAVLREIEIQKPRRDASKAGRSYWLEACQGMGIYEKDGALWLEEQQQQRQHPQQAAAAASPTAPAAASSPSHRPPSSEPRRP